MMYLVSSSRVMVAPCLYMSVTLHNQVVPKSLTIFLVTKGFLCVIWLLSNIFCLQSAEYVDVKKLVNLSNRYLFTDFNDLHIQ